MAREILIHLNVEAPDDDPRTEDEIADALAAVINGAKDDTTRELVPVVVLVEEV